MKADEINTLALLIAKHINESCSRNEMEEITAFLSQIMCNLHTYMKFKQK